MMRKFLNSLVIATLIAASIIIFAKVILLLFIGTLTSMTLFFAGTLTFMENYLVVDDKLAKADAVVVLMGANPTRMPVAAELIMDGYADILIIAQGTSTEAAEGRRDAIELGVLENIIIIAPGQATSTWDEAVIVRDYLTQRKDINSLILVNSSRQTRRTLKTFDRVLGSLDRDIILMSKAAGYGNFQDERWWEDLRNIESILIESTKYFFYYLRF